MTFKTSTTLIFLLAVSLFASAQEEKKLSLEEAIALGLKNSKQLKTDQAKIGEASAAYREAKEKKLPDAGISGAYMRLSHPNINLKTKDNNGGGGSGSGETPNVSQAAYGMLNVSLPIYTGGKIRYGIESAAFLQKATELDAAHDKGMVIQNTIAAFANLFKAGTAVKLVEENLAQSQQRVKELSSQEKNGLLARNDLLKAQWQSSNIELSLLDAQNNLQVANLNMNLMLGLPADTKLFPDTNGIARSMDDRVLDDYLGAALLKRNDLEAIDYRKQAAESSVKGVKGEKLPSLKLTGGYIAADIPEVVSITNAVNIGVGVSYNIGSLWKTRSKVEQAEARVKQLSLAADMMQDDIRLQVSRDYLSLLSYRKKIEVMERALEQAAENYRIVKNKFDNNLATLSDLLEADTALLQSKMAHTLARADAYVAYHQLLLSAGLLTEEKK